MPSSREYVEALRRMPQDAPCVDANGYKLSTVREVLKAIDTSRPSAQVPTLPVLRDGVVVC